MKITFVLSSGFTLSGGDRVIATYAQRLQQRGHDVLVVSARSYNHTLSLKARVSSLLKGKGWPPAFQPPPSHFDHLSVPRQLRPHWGPITDNDVPDADVVIATWWKTAEWVNALSPRKGAKVYLVQNHETFDYLPQDRVAATYILPFHKIVIAKWLSDLMATQYQDRDTSLVPNSVELQQFVTSQRHKQKVPTVGMLYSQLAWKGCDISLTAFSMAAQTIPNLRLIAFGACELQENLPLPAKSEYHQRPAQDAIKDIYAQCDAWLFGSRLEGFGLPILEAMACRTPVIGTPAGAAPELLTDRAGILVNHEDPVAMAGAIENICQLSDKAWQAMSTAAFKKATSYTWDDATELFEAALKTAIQNSLGDGSK